MYCRMFPSFFLSMWLAKLHGKTPLEKLEGIYTFLSFFLSLWLVKLAEKNSLEKSKKTTLGKSIRFFLSFFPCGLRSWMGKKRTSPGLRKKRWGNLYMSFFLSFPVACEVGWRKNKLGKIGKGIKRGCK